jgi:hypothetical protein
MLMNYPGSGANAPLIDFAIKGLEKCWLPSVGRWSHIYHLDGREQPNESVPESDLFYTLNVLLGMTRINQVPANIDMKDIFRRNVIQLLEFPVPKYAFGMAMWTSGELNEALPAPVLIHIELMLADKRNWFAFSAQDLGMILIGVIAQAKYRPGPSPWAPLATALFNFLNEHYYCRSNLFFNSPRGLRRYFASFATQTYLTLACYIYGEFANCRGAIELANSATRKLLELQGPSGEWPWFFDVPNGTVVDFYEVYSVHQYGMAPAFLQFAERLGVPEAHTALTKGFRWVFGENQMHRSMLMPAAGLSIRSQVRSGETRTKIFRVGRTVYHTIFGRASGLIDPAGLQLRLECRSYELGWILWSFGKRSDLPELTHHSAFWEQVQT